MPFGSYFKARGTALALLCCCTVLITLPALSSALKSSRDEIIAIQSKKQAHRESFRDDYDDACGTSSSAAARAPLFNSLFWDEGMYVTRFHTCLKAELSRAML